MRKQTGIRVGLAMVLVGAVLGVGVRSASAITLFATSLEGSAIVRVDTGTQAVSPFLSTPSAADSLIFDSLGRVVYTQLNTGTIRRFDPSSNTDVLLASGMSSPADLVLEPGGNTLFVSEFAGGRIDRLNLTTLALTPLLTPGGNPEGLAYDSTGRLFANLGTRFSGPGKFVAQIDPVTGAILGQTALLNSLDGLTFDPLTDMLYASSLFGNGFYVIDPNNLANVTAQLGTNMINPDGVTTDGAGNIYFASRGTFRVFVYNIAGNTLTQNAFVDGLDDLAPAIGLGSAPTAAPEPLSAGLGGMGLLGLLGAATARRGRRT